MVQVLDALQHLGQDVYTPADPVALPERIAVQGGLPEAMRRAEEALALAVQLRASSGGEAQ